MISSVNIVIIIIIIISSSSSSSSIIIIIIMVFGLKEDLCLVGFLQSGPGCPEASYVVLTQG